MVKIINIISNHAKFPFSYIKGSEKQRFYKAESLTQNVFDYMEDLGGNNWNTHLLKNALDKYTFPNKIKIIIANENDNNYLGSLQEIVSAHDYKNYTDFITKNFGKKNIFNTNINEPFTVASLDGYKLSIRLKNGKINNIYTVLHEVRHLFDHLCNPKISTMPRKNVMANATKEQRKAYNEIYDMLFNNKKHTNFNSCKKEIIKKLEIIPNYKKINILQGIRNSIKTEINAYTQERKKQFEKLSDALLNISDKISILKMIRNYNKKREFITKLLKDCIKTERLNNK